MVDVITPLNSSGLCYGQQAQRCRSIAAASPLPLLKTTAREFFWSRVINSCFGSESGKTHSIHLVTSTATATATNTTITANEYLLFGCDDHVFPARAQDGLDGSK